MSEMPTPAKAPAATVARNAAIDSAAQMVVMAMGLVAGVVLARQLGSEGRGAYVLATSFAAQLVIGLTNLGLELAASVFLARKPERAAQAHGCVIGASALVGLAAVAAAMAVPDFLVTWLVPGLDARVLLMLAVALPFFVYQFGAYGMAVGLGMVRFRAFFDVGLNLLQNVLIVVLLLAATSDEQAVDWLIVAYYGTAMAGAAALALLVARRIGGLAAMPSGGDLREMLRLGFSVYIGNAGATVSQRIDQYMVQQAQGPAAFGVYTLAVGLAQRTRVFPQALSRSVYARLGQVEEREAALLSAACFRQVLALGIGLTLVGAAMSPLIPVIYSREFAPAILPFIIFLVGRAGHSAAWMLANFFSAHLGRPDIPMVLNWGLLPLQAVLAWLAVRHGGLVAVASATALAYILTLAGFVLLFLRRQKHAGLRDLFVLGMRDVTPWTALLGGIFGWGRGRGRAG